MGPNYSSITGKWIYVITGKDRFFKGDKYTQNHRFFTWGKKLFQNEALNAKMALNEGIRHGDCDMLDSS